MRRQWALRVVVLGLGFALAGCSTFVSRTLPQGEASREWRAAWVLNIQDDIKDAASARQVVEEARSMNLNALYLVSVYQGFAYYPSQVAPIFVPPGTFRPLDFDPIQAMIDAARERRGRPLQIFAWVNFCNVWEQRGMIPPSHPVIQHPDWLTAHADLNRPPDEVPEFWLDPGVPAVQIHAAEICRELAAKYDLDGILLDSIQYRPNGFGYNPTALQRFAHETARLDRPAPSDPQWQEWRCRQVNNLLERMVLAIRSQKPGLPIAIAGSAEGPLTPRFEESQAYAQLGQNWPKWLDDNLADVLVLKNFKRQANSEQAKEFLDWLALAKIHSSGKAVVCGISGRDNALLATQTQVLAARQAEVQGMAIWRYRDNNTEGRPRKALFGLLKSKVFSSRAKPPAIPWLRKIGTGIVAGQVRGEALQPMSNVRVQFPSLDRETYSHSDGLFVLFGVPAGITIAPQAYQAGSLYPAERNVEAKPGQIAATDIVMTRRQ